LPEYLQGMTNRSHSVEVAEFLRGTLAGRAVGVPNVEAMARAAGLLGEDQRITHAKAFKTAKKSLGIRSVRNGFGSAGAWLWLLEQPDSLVGQPPQRSHVEPLLVGSRELAACTTITDRLIFNRTGGANSCATATISWPLAITGRTVPPAWAGMR
jgi:hypothetical protein